MSDMKFIDSLIRLIPTVEKPLIRPTFKEKLKWTLIILVLFLILAQIPLYGVSADTTNFLREFGVLLASHFGTIMSLGIGPIVTSSIILQMLVGAKILNWDIRSTDGRARFQGVQKLLALVFCFVDAAAFVLMGSLPPEGGAAILGVGLIFQLALGGVLVIFMDDVISKWGIGSGVSLFIVAGVAQEIIVRAFNPIVLPGQQIPAGMITGFIGSLLQGSPAWTLLLPVVMTLIVFAIVVYAQGIKVEIPLAFGNVRGFGRRWPLNFIYTSNMPVILAAALLLNVQLLAGAMASPVPESEGTVCGFLGCLQEGQAVSGAIYYMTPPRQLLFDIFQGIASSNEILRALSYTIFLTSMATLFAYFWVQTSGMDSRSVAEQIQKVGLQIPGFRRDPRIIEAVLDRYIMPLTIMGGVFVGLLASFADITGAIAGGTGILLAVMIIYNLYEQIVTQNMEEMHPAIRKFMGSQ